MSDIRGQGPDGKPRNVRTDGRGRVHTLLYGLDRFGNPQPVRVSPEGLLLSGGRTVATPFTPIPGIGAASAYADEDAFGTKFYLEVPTSGVIQGALSIDDDDEAIDVDLILYGDDITSGTDNSAYAPSLTDMRNLQGVVSLTSRFGVSGASLGVNPGLAQSYVAPKGKLWVQAVARGALNIAAGKQYLIALRIVADE